MHERQACSRAKVVSLFNGILYIVVRLFHEARERKTVCDKQTLFSEAQLFYRIYLWTLQDTLVGSRRTFSLDPFVGHARWTLLWDTFFAGHLWDRVLDTPQELVSWVTHLWGTFLNETQLQDTFVGYWHGTLAGNPCKALCVTILSHTLIRHSCARLLQDTLVWHLWDTLGRYFCKTVLPFRPCETLLCDVLTRRSCGAFLHDTLPSSAWTGKCRMLTPGFAVDQPSSQSKVDIPQKRHGKPRFYCHDCNVFMFTQMIQRNRHPQFTRGSSGTTDISRQFDHAQCSYQRCGRRTSSLDGDKKGVPSRATRWKL